MQSTHFIQSFGGTRSVSIVYILRVFIRHTAVKLVTRLALRVSIFWLVPGRVVLPFDEMPELYIRRVVAIVLVATCATLSFSGYRVGL